jgi:hypothetical protein
MQPAGIVSHGPFEFGTKTSDGIQGMLATYELVWIESAHFEIGIALPTYRLKVAEKKKIVPELEQLAAVLPTVSPSAKELDPWLRAHLFAQRSEQVYRRFQELMGVEDADFPGPEGRKLDGKKYMGEGPYLGQRSKYEILLLPSQAACKLYLSEEFGLPIETTQRWHYIPRDTLSVTIHTEEGSLRTDEALHAHLAYNLGHNLLDGYKHYNYDTALWLRVGLAHLLEREISPDYNTFDYSEGTAADSSNKSDWAAEVRKLVRDDKASRLAAMLRLRELGELSIEDHFTSWSMTDYLVRVNPAGYACIHDAIHGVVNQAGFPDGSNQPEVHRAAFEECLNMNYFEFDTAWAEWVKGGTKPR